MEHFDIVFKVILTGILLFIWSDIRGQRKAMETYKEKIDTKIESISSKFLRTKDHGLICDNSTLRLEKHIDKTNQELKDALFMELRKIKDLFMDAKG